MSGQVSFRTPRIHVSLRGLLVDDTDGLVVRSPHPDPVAIESPIPPERIGLVEETSYTVWAQSQDEHAISIRHADPVVTAKVRTENEGRVATGTIWFGSHVGRTRLLVFLEGAVELEIEVSVSPSKVSWSVVSTMRDEVEAVWAGLPLAALRPTYDPRAAGLGVPSVPVWMALLRASVTSLDGALREIARRPIPEVARRPERVRASRATRPDASVRRSVRRAGGVVPEVVETRRAQLTLDTPSHRWLAARVRRVVDTLARLMREEAARTATERRGLIIKEMEGYRRQLAHHLSRGPLSEVSTDAPAVPPLTLRRRPVYSTAYDALHQLDGGLSRTDGEVWPSLLDLAGLYEAWCGLTLVREASEVLGDDPGRRPFGLYRSGTGVYLTRGKISAVRLEGRGVSIEITYSPRFASPQSLLAQTPDFLVTFEGASTHRVVLDAKYRRDASSTRYGIAGPPADAIGALHRYRDAILAPDGSPGWIDDAIALFPPADDVGAFDTSRLWSGLVDIGIGALPLAPGQTEWLRRWLELTVRRIA